MMIRRRNFTRFTACALSVIVGGSAILAGAVGYASASSVNAGPDVFCCGQFFSSVSLWVNATNATIDFTTAFDPTPPIAVDFGNTSAGEIFTQNVTVYNPTTLKGAFFLNYLEPSNYPYPLSTTAYDFKLVADGGGRCTHGGVEYYCYYDGQFNTTTEAIQHISGNVALVGGGHPPAGLNVQVYCPPFVQQGYGALGLTTSNGNFEVSTQGYTIQHDCGTNPLTVTAYSAKSGGWLGDWNETIVVWAPQDSVTFDLAANAIGPWLPIELEYTNSQYVNLSFSQTDTITTTYTATAGGNGGSSSSSFTAQESGASHGSDDETWVKYYSSGTYAWFALTRAAATSGVIFYGSIQNSTSQNLLNDSLSPSSITSAKAFGNGLWYSYNITPGHERGGNVTVTGTVTDISGFQGDLGVSFDVIPGVSISVSIPIDATFSTSYTYTNTLSFTVFNSAGVNHGFRACVEGGSNTTSGLILHVWQIS